MLLFAIASLALACPEVDGDAALSSASEVEIAFANLDQDSFYAHSERLKVAMACINRDIAHGDAVRLHRAMALVAFSESLEEESIMSWAAVKALAPKWRGAPALMPEGHPLRVMFEHAESSGEELPISVPRNVTWQIDGVQKEAVPLDRAFVLIASKDGEVVYSGYHRSVYQLPHIYSTPIHKRSDPLRRAGVWSAGGLALGSAVALVGHKVTAGQISDPATHPDELTLLQTRANKWGATSATLAVSSLAIGAMSFHWKW